MADSVPVLAVEPRPAEAFVIRGWPYSPINVVLQDFAPGQGRLILEIDGDAWSHYWGAMTGRSLREFVAGCSSADYLVGKLLSGRRATKAERARLTGAVEIVRRALREAEVANG